MKETINKIRSDYYRYRGGDLTLPFYKILIYLLVGRNHSFNYSFWLRLAHKKSLFWPIAKIMHKRLSTKYCLDIPTQCQIGYGLYLGHGMCMVINEGTIIGNNVNLSQFLNIGTNMGTPAIIGDNV